MLPYSRWLRAALLLAVWLLVASAVADAQGRGKARPPGAGGAVGPPPPAPTVRVPAVRGQYVFIGGYFYDPFFGPYPWWPTGIYPYPYFPVYDYRADIRLHVKPEEAAVYVDGFYAGVVDDFNGVFQALPLPPGGHRIDLYLPGYRTVTRMVYLRPASTFHVHELMEPLAPGLSSAPPMLAPPVPAPPDGTARPPVTPPSAALSPPLAADEGATTYGSLLVTIQPPDAVVRVDGALWSTTDGGRFELAVPAGRHRVEVSAPGYATYRQDVEVPAGASTAVNVSLTRPF